MEGLTASIGMINESWLNSVCIWCRDFNPYREKLVSCAPTARARDLLISVTTVLIVRILFTLDLLLNARQVDGVAK